VRAFPVFSAWAASDSRINEDRRIEPYPARPRRSVRQRAQRPVGKVPVYRQAALAQNCQPVVHVGGGFRKSFTNFTTGNGYSFGGEYLELISNERFRDTDKCG
jgi:hypothetical protein